MTGKSWSSLTHAIYRSTLDCEAAHKKILISFSGGADSVFLVMTLLQFLDASQIELFHYHHGGDGLSYREQALQFAKDFSAEHKLRLHFRKSAQTLRAEDECRRARRSALFQVFNETQMDLISTAHHADDLLETRLLRLIRGVGPQGIEAMKAFDPPFFRPLLGFRKTEILSELKVPFVEDPSNQELDHTLRNWIREKWLKDLENEIPGSVRRLSESLQNLTTQTSSPQDNEKFEIVWDKKNQSFQLTDFWLLTKDQQKKLVAQIYRSLDSKNYSINSILEVLKQLGKPQNGHTFKSGSLIWIFNAGRVNVEGTGVERTDFPRAENSLTT